MPTHSSMTYFDGITETTHRKYNRVRYMLWVYLPMIKKWNKSRFNNNNPWLWYSKDDELRGLLSQTTTQGQLDMNISNNWQDFQQFLSVKVNRYNTVNGIVKHLFDMETQYMQELRERWETTDQYGNVLQDCDVCSSPFNLIQYDRMLDSDPYNPQPPPPPNQPPLPPNTTQLIQLFPLQLNLNLQHPQSQITNLNFIQNVHPVFSDLDSEDEKYERVRFILNAPSPPFNYSQRILSAYSQLGTSHWSIVTRNSSIPRQSGVIPWTFSVPDKAQRPARFMTYFRNTEINEVSLQNIIQCAIDGETDIERDLRRYCESTIYQSENISVDLDDDEGHQHDTFNDLLRTFIRDAHNANYNIMREIAISIQRTYMNIEERFTEQLRLQLNEIEYRRVMSNILRTELGFPHTVSEEHFYEIRSNTSSAVKKYADIRMCITDINHVWIFELKRYRGGCYNVVPKFKHKEQLYMYCLMERMIQEEENNGRMKVHGVLVYFCNNGVSYWYMQDHRYRMRNIQSIDRIDFEFQT